MVVLTRFATTSQLQNRRNYRIADITSSEPPKKEDKGKGMPKKEALDARVTELSTSLQEMMADVETSGQESSANETLLTTRQADPSQSAPTDGLHHRESYCLQVRVVKDAFRLSERDVRLPAHAWNEDIAVDICESRIWMPGRHLQSTTTQRHGVPVKETTHLRSRNELAECQHDN